MPTQDQIIKDSLFRGWADTLGYACNAADHSKDLLRLSYDELLSLYRRFYLDKGILPPWEAAPISAPSPTLTAQQKADYKDYLAFIKQYPELGLPVPKDIRDFVENQEKWANEFVPPEEPGPKEPELGEPGYKYTDEQNREFNTYRRYASAYGDPKDWYPISIDDYFKNHDVALEQQKEWKAEETTKAEEQAEREAKQAEYGKWALSPEEQAERREESYQAGLEAKARTEYARQEAYGETPRYQEPFVAWLATQGDKSMALQNYIESKYPSLRTQYEATQQRLTGYPTRERARAEAGRRETGFEAWLSTQLPAVEEEFWGQPPARRGERPAAYAPRMRHINW